MLTTMRTTTTMAMIGPICTKQVLRNADEDDEDADDDENNDDDDDDDDDVDDDEDDDDYADY